MDMNEEDPVGAQNGPLECLLQISAIVRNSTITAVNLEEIRGHAINWLTMAHSHMVLFDAIQENAEDDPNAQLAFYYRYAEAVFALDDRTCPGIQRTYQQKLRILENVIVDLRKINLLPCQHKQEEFQQSPVMSKTLKLVNRIAAGFYSFYHLLYHTQRLVFMRFSESSELLPFEMVLSFKDAPVELNDALKVLYFSLNQLSLMGAVRMDNTYVMVPRYTPENYKTGSFQLLCPISELLPKIVNPMQHKMIFELLASKDSLAAQVVRNLSSYSFAEFPDLKVRRTLFSFANGIFDAEKAIFRSYGPQDQARVNFLSDVFRHHPAENGGPVFTGPFSIRNAEDYRDIEQSFAGEAGGSMFTWNFGSSADDQRQQLLDGTVGLDLEASVKYFNQQFPAHLISCEDPMQDIATPSLDKVFEAQDLGPRSNPDVLEWIYALMGRMLRDVKADGWELCPFFKGVAGTGKSTILKVLHLFYNSEDVGVLSNNVEAQFGLAPLVNKKIVLCMELRQDFRLSQAELQSMLSGEEMSLAQKHKDPITTSWSAPLAFAGNTLGGWSEGQGSIGRRFVIINFPKPVLEADPTLMKRINDEMPAILLKCNAMYLLKRKLLQRRGFWTEEKVNDKYLVPQYFRDRRRELEEQVSSVAQFLGAEGNFNFGDNGNDPDTGLPLFMEWNKFKIAYKKWCVESSIKPVNLENKEHVNRHFTFWRLTKSNTDPYRVPCSCIIGATMGGNLLKLLESS